MCYFGHRPNQGYKVANTRHDMQRELNITIAPDYVPDDVQMRISTTENDFQKKYPEAVVSHNFVLI